MENYNYYYSNKYAKSFCAVCLCDATGVFLKCCQEKQFLCVCCFKNIMTQKMTLTQKKEFDSHLKFLLAISQTSFCIHEIKKLFLMYSIVCPFCRKRVKLIDTHLIKKQLLTRQ